MKYVFIICFALMACNKSTKTAQKSMTEIASFGTMPDGTEVNHYTLSNANGIEVKVINYGGIITSIKTPDREGNLNDIVLGYDDLQSYLDLNPYFGAIVGRYGNRIAKGKFVLDNIEYKLAINNIGNHLHGGEVGFDKVIWKVTPYESEQGAGLKLKYVSKDMEEGYPGNLEVTVTYFLTRDNSLEFEYSAKTDKKTVINLTQHSYFNLKGSGDILEHELVINAGRYVPVDSTLIPTGELVSVKDTPFDFTASKPIGKDINESDPQIKIGGGFDHCWVISKNEDGLSIAASVYESSTGRAMDVLTSEPGVQFYSGNFLDGQAIGKSGTIYSKRTGLCLETQHFPDSPNQPNFPSTVLNPDDEYQSKTVLKFYTKN